MRFRAKGLGFRGLHPKPKLRCACLHREGSYEWEAQYTPPNILVLVIGTLEHEHPPILGKPAYVRRDLLEQEVS